MPIFSKILHHAEDVPDTCAVASPTQHLTYRELADAALTMRARLGTLTTRSRTPEIGITGSIIALSLQNSLAFFPAFAAATSAGHAAALLQPSLPDSTLIPILRQLEPDAIILDAPRRALAEIVEQDPDRVLPMDGISDITNFMTQAPINAPGCEGARFPIGAPHSTFLIGLTSGTTALPKIFHRNRRTWQISLEQHETVFGLTAQDRVLAPGPLSHGLTLYAAAEALFAGAAFHFLNRFDARETLDVIETQAITRLTLVPAMLHHLIDQAGNRTYPSVTAILSAGAKLTKGMQEKALTTFPKARIIEYYGASELSFVTMTPRTGLSKPASIGKAYSGVSVSIRDKSGDRELPVGEIGTLYVDSPLISDGYCFRTDASGMARKGRWATVGDQAWQDQDGYFYLAGREGDVINSGGNSFYPAEIETVILDFSNIDAVCVFAQDDERLSEIPVAAIETRVTEPNFANDLRSHCIARLPRYKVPRRLFALARLPRTESGKIDKGALTAMVAADDSKLREL